MIDLKLIGSRIRSLRQQCGLTQNEFAEILGVSFQAVSNWERGIAPPELENLLRIATHFGITTDEILRPREDACYLGIDGGGTKTEFTLVSSEGRVLKRICKGGSNPNDIGFEKTLALIYEGITKTVAEYPLLKSIFLGVAGISVSNYADKLRIELKTCFPAIDIQVKTDVFNLFAIDESVNMAVISGTGSVVFVRNGEDYRRIGGWGYLLDRAGSAYDIGRDAVTLALKEEDRRLSPSLISRLLREKFNTATVWEQVNKLYTEGKPYIASLAPVVFKAYEAGDDDAIRIVDENAKALAELLNTGIGVYGARPVAIANGGLFEHYPHIMTRHINNYTDTKLLINEFPPVYGACKIARAMNGELVPDEFYNNFKETYR